MQNDVRLFDLCRTYAATLGNCPAILNSVGIFPIERDRYGNHLYPARAANCLAELAEKKNAAIDRLHALNEPAPSEADGAGPGVTIYGAPLTSFVSYNVPEDDD